LTLFLAAICIGALVSILTKVLPGHTGREARAAARAASSPQGARGPGVLWFGFNSSVCVVGGCWVLWSGLWWGALVIIAGIAGIPFIARKARAGNWL